MSKKFIRYLGWSASVSVFVQLMPSASRLAWCLPPLVDTPEEVLRTEIITQARSPVDGKPLNAAQYSKLKLDLATDPAVPKLSPDLRQNIFLIRLLKVVRTVFPFFPTPKVRLKKQGRRGEGEKGRRGEGERGS